MPEYAKERERLDTVTAADAEDVGAENEDTKATSSEHSSQDRETSTSSARKKIEATESEKTVSTPEGGDR